MQFRNTVLHETGAGRTFPGAEKFTTPHKARVLFLCTGTSCRSRMAEAWANHLGSAWLEARAAGIESHGENPRAVAVMHEAGMDISRRESARLTSELLAWADLVVTVCQQGRRILSGATARDAEKPLAAQRSSHGNRDG